MKYGVNKTILKYQLLYFIKESYLKNLTEVTSQKNADGLSGMDKMEMNLQKVDEGLIILAEIGIKRELERIIRDNDFDITDDEIDYYIHNHHLSHLQTELIYSYWSKYFGSSRNTHLINRKEYIILTLILKKKLLIHAGYNATDKNCKHTVLPYLLTGNILDRVNTRLIRNNKYVNKVDESDVFKYLNTNKYSNLNRIRPDYILSLLSQINNTTFTYVVYEDPDLLGKEIEYNNEDKISDELLFFLATL